MTLEKMSGSQGTYKENKSRGPDMHEAQNLFPPPPSSERLGEANLCTVNSKHLASWILGIKIRYL